MEQKRLLLDGGLLCRGVGLASSRSEEPILCLIKEETIRFVAISGLRLVISWEARLQEPVPGSLAFVLPPTVARLLASDVISQQVGVCQLPRGIF